MGCASLQNRSLGELQMRCLVVNWFCKWTMNKPETNSKSGFAYFLHEKLKTYVINSFGKSSIYASNPKNTLWQYAASSFCPMLATHQSTSAIIWYCCIFWCPAKEQASNCLSKYRHSLVVDTSLSKLIGSASLDWLFSGGLGGKSTGIWQPPPNYNTTFLLFDWGKVCLQYWKFIR